MITRETKKLLKFRSRGSSWTSGPGATTSAHTHANLSVDSDGLPLTPRLNLVVQVWDKEKIVLIPDHYIFTADEKANRNVDILRDFAKEQQIKYFYDITDRSNFKVRFMLTGLREY